MDKITVPLSLNTYDINASNTITDYVSAGVDSITTHNQYGMIANYRHTYEWYGIDMKKVLGDLYDEYELFNIKLVSFGGSSSGTAVPDDNLRNLKIELSGLSFLSSYDFSSQSQYGKATVGMYQFPTTASTAFSANQTNDITHTFIKCQRANIRINLVQMLDGETPTLTNNQEVLGQTNWLFIITPIDKRFY